MFIDRSAFFLQAAPQCRQVIKAAKRPGNCRVQHVPGNWNTKGGSPFNLIKISGLFPGSAAGQCLMGGLCQLFVQTIYTNLSIQTYLYKPIYTKMMQEDLFPDRRDRWEASSPPIAAAVVVRNAECKDRPTPNRDPFRKETS